MRVSFVMTMILIAIFMAGCGSKWCLTAGGSYGEYTGEVTYCYDEKTSESTGKVSFTTGSGEKVVGLSLNDLLQIKDELTAKPVETKAVETKAVETKAAKTKLFDKIVSSLSGK